MTSGRSGDAANVPPFAGIPERPICPLCGGFLREGHKPDDDNPHGLCDPCLEKVRQCTPFASCHPQHVPDEITGPAPAGANVLALAAGLLLIHEALHPGERLDLRGALTTYGVELDNVAAHKLVNKLRRRHGLVVHGEPRETGYAVEDWTYVARRVRSSLKGA